MKHIVITGVSRGIGLKLLELSLNNGDHVCGIARTPDVSQLMELKKKFGDNLLLLKGDVNDKGLGQKIREELPWKHIDVLLNNAGILLNDSWEGFEKTFLTNSIAPYFLTESLRPLLEKSSEPKAVFISSMMGSIADNSSGGSVSYRASKAALNMIVKSLSVEERWLTCLIFHPGWVRTEMGGKEAPVDPVDSARGILSLIHSSGKDSSGTFRTYQGQKLPW